MALFVMLSFVTGPLLLFLIPLSDVNDGAKDNMTFIFLTMPLNATTGMILWVALVWMTVYGGHSSSSTQPSQHESRLRLLPPTSTLLSISLTSLCATVVFITLLSAALSIPHVATPAGVFPLPFSTLSMGVPAVLVFFSTVAFLLLTRHGSPHSQGIIFHNAVYRIIGQLLVVSATFVLCVISGVAWAMVFGVLKNKYDEASYLEDYSSSASSTAAVTAARRRLYAWIWMYEPLLYGAKFYVLAPIAASVNPKKWLVICQTLNIFFLTFLLTALQRSPSNPMQLFQLFVCRILSIMWRACSANDRFEMLFSRLWDNVVAAASRRSCGNWRRGGGMSSGITLALEAHADLPRFRRTTKIHNTMIFTTSRLTFHAMKMEYDQVKEERISIRRQSATKIRVDGPSFSTTAAPAARGTRTSAPRESVDVGNHEESCENHLVIAEQLLVDKSSSRVGVSAEDSSPSVSAVDTTHGASYEAFHRESSIGSISSADSQSVNIPRIHQSELASGGASIAGAPNRSQVDEPRANFISSWNRRYSWDRGSGRLSSSSLSRSVASSEVGARSVMEVMEGGIGFNKEECQQIIGDLIPPSPVPRLLPKNARSSRLGWRSSRLILPKAATVTAAAEAAASTAASLSADAEEGLTIAAGTVRELKKDETARLGLFVAVKVALCEVANFSFVKNVSFEIAEQRAYFLLLDIVSGEASDIVVRLHFILATIMMNYGPNRDNFISLQDFADDNVLASMAWLGLVAIMNCVTVVSLLYFMVDRKAKIGAGSEGDKNGKGGVNLRKILLYLYGREHYIFLAVLHGSISMFCWSCFEAHHGFDFTLGFLWIGCGYGRGHENFVMHWPLCVQVSHNITDGSVST